MAGCFSFASAGCVAVDPVPFDLGYVRLIILQKLLDPSCAGLSNEMAAVNSAKGERLFMRFVQVRLELFLATLILASAVVSSAFAAEAQSFTGKVSDAMCGAKHMMEGDPAACLRACVQKGSKYALVVGDKVYTLDTQDQATLASLDKLANRKATVKGQANGDVIEVSSVTPAK
jgi:hypothetical protein